MNKKTKFGIFLLVTTLVILVACKSTSEKLREENETIEKGKIPSKPALEDGHKFTIEYKDGKVENITASSVIWSETKDVIYFKGNNGESIKEISKSLVSNVK